MIMLGRVAKNVNHFFEFIKSKRAFHNDIYDMVNQCNILKEKIDFTWSDRKLKDIHQKWTARIMDIKKKYISEEIYYSIEKIREAINWLQSNEIRLISNSLELFAEGTYQHHCVYTNYNHRVKKADYFVMHDNVSGGTIGISQSGSFTDRDGNTMLGWKIDQIRKKFNNPIDPHRERLIERLINSERTQILLNILKQDNNENYKKIPPQIEVSNQAGDIRLLAPRTDYDRNIRTNGNWPVSVPAIELDDLPF
jgi:hypothetical protein